ncbi:histidine kinase [Streptomyces uncialis]|uniref:sensor histidine kinase n=1 Tax=Streptomyces uncialis TaxID=1048205 RepID=UPI002E323326|nr:histidine kinase [Streptomyces uncialis]
MIAPLLAAFAVITTDTAVLAARLPGDPPSWAGLLGTSVLLTGVVLLSRRSPVGAFVTALLLFSLLPAVFALLLWTGYAAGRALVTRGGTAVTAGAACGGLAVQLLAAPDDAGITQLVTAYLVFVAMPLLVGRHQAQHDQLVDALSQRNEELLRRQELLAERERLAERLRIARDMHDSLGQRLSLVSVQAAALEVTDLPPDRRDGVRQLARTTRAAMDELHELVGALRGTEDPGRPAPGPAGIERLVADFRTAGLPVELSRTGRPVPLPDATWRTAYRVVQEGLTNAAKHAGGRPAEVALVWERDALLLTVVTPEGPGAAATAVRPSGPGHGLVGLGERVRQAGGLLDHGPHGGGFRLLAMLPAGEGPPPGSDRQDAPYGPAGEGVGGGRTRERGFPYGPGGDGRESTARVAVRGVAAAVLVLVVLPAGFLLGVR